MNAETIERWVKCLGENYASLVQNRTIPNQPLRELYPGRDLLDISISPGLSMSFWAETRCLESIFITLVKTTPSTAVYKGTLPKPFTSSMSQADVRSNFGVPTNSQAPVKMPQPAGMTGGWDAYRLDSRVHSNAKVVFQYTATSTVKTIVFSLIDKGHN